MAGRPRGRRRRRASSGRRGRAGRTRLAGRRRWLRSWAGSKPSSSSESLCCYGSENRRLDETGDRIVMSEDRALDRASKRAEVTTSGQPSVEDLPACVGEVGRKPHPSLAGSRPRLLQLFTARQLPEQEGEVDAGSGTEAVPPPYAGIGVEQEEPTRLRIALELDLCKAGIARRRKQPGGGALDPGGLDGLDVCAGPAEVRGILSGPPCRGRGEHASVEAEGREGKLRFTTARNDLLNHERVGRDKRARFVVAFQELASTVHAPCLCGRQPVEDGFDGGLEDHWELTFKGLDLRGVPRVCRPGVFDANVICELVRQSLVVHPAKNFPRRHGHDEPPGEGLAMT